jgi:hypothetical protein
MADTKPFEAALKEAKKSLEEAKAEHRAIEKRIVSLRQTIEGLSALCEPEPSEDLVYVEDGGNPYGFKLTDAIRLIFSGSTEPVLTAPEIRDALQANGVNIAKYKQPLVPIHNTLKRLVTQGELVEFRDDNGELRGYQWVTPLARAVAEVSAPSVLKLSDLLGKEPPKVLRPPHHGRHGPERRRGGE